MTHPTSHQIPMFAVGIRSGTALIHADLAVPDDARGVVLFAHGSGSSRFSRRNRAVAEALQHASFATLLVDLLTTKEASQDETTGQFRFDIELLTTRVAAATDWLAHDPRTRALPIGYFGASTGAAAALKAAARRATHVKSVVSRGGRPDLAGDALPVVRAPTLLIVGGYDPEVLALNRQAQRQLRCENQLLVIPGATHLFEEPGTLEAVTAAASSWFEHHLKGESGASAAAGW